VTGFLYPFLEREPPEIEAVLADLAFSARTKTTESAALAAATLDRERARLQIVAAEMTERFGLGRRLFSFGNGGSSSDAASVAALFSTPPWGTALPARALVADTAILTALGNDVGFDLVFSRQLIAYAKQGDVAIGLSTSGNSRNLLAAFAEARSRGMLTIGFAGYDGGDMGCSADVTHCFVVDCDSVHRIQEAQGALVFALWSAVQRCLAGIGHDA
jgi:D-sedoheptulose 7-phosphate isomerase